MNGDSGSLTPDPATLPKLWERFYGALKELRTEFDKTGGTIQVDITIRDAAAAARHAKRKRKKS